MDFFHSILEFLLFIIYLCVLTRSILAGFNRKYFKKYSNMPVDGSSQEEKEKEVEWIGGQSYKFGWANQSLPQSQLPSNLSYSSNHSNNGWLTMIHDWNSYYITQITFNTTLHASNKVNAESNGHWGSICIDKQTNKLPQHHLEYKDISKLAIEHPFGVYWLLVAFLFRALQIQRFRAAGAVSTVPCWVSSAALGRQCAASASLLLQWIAVAEIGKSNSGFAMKDVETTVPSRAHT